MKYRKLRIGWSVGLLTTLAFAVWALGATGHTPPHSGNEKPSRFTLPQRSSTEIDITGSMVLVSIQGKKAESVLRETPIGRDEEVPFEIDGRKYELELAQLENELIGEDRATFVVRRIENSDDTALKRRDCLSAKLGTTVSTNVSGSLRFKTLTPKGFVEMRSAGRDFALQPGNWCWISRDEILKICSFSGREVAFRLYQPAPTAKPF